MSTCRGAQVCPCNGRRPAEIVRKETIFDPSPAAVSEWACPPLPKNRYVRNKRVKKYEVLNVVGLWPDLWRYCMIHSMLWLCHVTIMWHLENKILFLQNLIPKTQSNCRSFFFLNFDSLVQLNAVWYIHVYQCHVNIIWPVVNGLHSVMLCDLHVIDNRYSKACKVQPGFGFSPALREWESVGYRLRPLGNAAYVACLPPSARGLSGIMIRASDQYSEGLWFKSQLDPGIFFMDLFLALSA